jgi:phage tail tube protein FII
MFKVKQYQGKGMEATIKFDLDNEYDQHMFEVMNKAQDLLLAIQEYDQRLRAMHKYEDVSDAYNYREILRGVLQDHNVNHLI